MTVALINYPNKQQDFNEFILPFLLRAQAVLRRHISVFFSGKIPGHVAAVPSLRLTCNETAGLKNVIKKAHVTKTRRQR